MHRDTRADQESAFFARPLPGGAVVTTSANVSIAAVAGFVVAAAAAGPPCGSSGELYVQCPDQSNGIYSSTGVLTRAAENFGFAVTREVAGLDWWGGLILGGDQAVFVITIHEDDPGDPGRPGAELQSWSPGVVIGQATGLTFTTFEVGGDFNEYAFHAELTPPFTASPDITYWIVVQETFECCGGGIFAWESSMDGDGFSMADRGDGIWDDPVGFDLAFAFYESAVTCPWDCAGNDGEIGIDEFLAVLGLWGDGHVGEPCDFDGDGTVGIDEFLKVLGFWGPCP